MTIRDDVYRLIERQLDVPRDTIRDDNRLVEDLGADELAMVEILIDLETWFEMDISDEDAEKLVTVGAIVEYVERRKEKGR